MQLLFPANDIYPHGFSYYDDFISVDEEAELLEVIAHLSLRPLIFQGFEAKRKVESYGYDYNFDNRTVSKGKPIPLGFSRVIGKIASLLNMQVDGIAEVLVTEYPTGSVINWHRDAPPFDIIVGLSLLADCKFQFRPYDKTLQSRSSIITLPVRQRSLYIMQGEARQAWEHKIRPVLQSRFSITFRTLR